MKRLLFKMLFCAAAVMVAGAALAQDPAVAPHVSHATGVTDLSMDFVRFWDATTALKPDDRLAAFKRDVAAKYPVFYGVERYKGEISQSERDQQIQDAIAQFGTIRESYIKKSHQFGDSLNVNLASFQRAFPDFDPSATQIYVLHSLGEMDGGTRDFIGGRVLIFGIDGMVKYHRSSSNESAFFHHELFHVLHEPVMGDCDAIWCALWVEGLAVQVSKILNPSANDDELLLTIPANLVVDTTARKREALLQLQSVLESTDKDLHRTFFSMKTDSNGLPGRRGYLLGYWVAQEICKDHSLVELSKMPAERVKPLVFAAVDKLIKALPADAGSN